MNSRKYGKINKLVMLGFFTSLALVISVFEGMLPQFVPIPGVKLGIANIITLFLVLNADKRSALAVLTVRVILASIFGGQIVSLFYSLFGGILCFIAMCITNALLKGKPVWFISVVGAVFHNIGQITAAVILMSWTVIYYFPFLLISGCVTGFLTGLLTGFINRRLERSGMLLRLRKMLGNSSDNADCIKSEERNR